MYQIKGFLYDVARGMRGDVNYIEKLMRRLSRYGYNMLVLNLEYRFQFPSHPQIATKDSLSTVDVKRLDAVSKELGMEIVPFVNCAGHNEGIGLLEKYKHLSVDLSGMMGTVKQVGQPAMSNPGSFAVEQLKIADEGVKQLIADLYSDLINCFSSKYFHIGFDEVRQMPVQLPQATEEERWEQVMEHLRYVIDLVLSKGKIPMLWGDMFLRHPERLSYIHQLPEEVVICDWCYDYTPDSLVKHIGTQTCFKEAGRKVVACPAVNGFRGNPILCEQSTGNIQSFNEAHQKVYGTDSMGVILCHWETDFGGCFTAHWPWIFLQSKIFDGKEYQGNSFLREYTKSEWELDTNWLEDWYGLIDEGVTNCILKDFLQENASINLNYLKRSVFRSQNILPVLQDARNWITHQTALEIIEILKKAKLIADKMYQNAQTNREESLRLIEWTNAYAAIFKLLLSLEKLEAFYHEAALIQGENEEKYCQNISHCVMILYEMGKEAKAIETWAQSVVCNENNSQDEVWWIGQSLKAFHDFAAALLSADGKSLLNFNRFIRMDLKIPNRVLNR